MVTHTAITGFDLRRTRRNSAEKVALSIRIANSTRSCRPPIAVILAKRTSLSHSHAYQGWPGLEKEKTSCVGTQPRWRIHSPVRMCQPVSQSLSRVLTPSIGPNRKTIGMRKAKSFSDGSSLTTNWERLASILVSGQPGISDRLHGFESANAVVERPEIHIVHAQRNMRKFFARIYEPDHCPLTMNTFLAEAMICG